MKLFHFAIPLALIQLQLKQRLDEGDDEEEDYEENTFDWPSEEGDDEGGISLPPSFLERVLTPFQPFSWCPRAAGGMHAPRR